MKRIACLGCIWIGLIGFGPLMADQAKQMDWGQEKIISLPEIKESVLDDFLEGNLKGCILECPAGLRIPLDFFIQGDILALDVEENPSLYVKILKTCYIRYEQETDFLFSTNLKEWNTSTQFFKGQINVSLGYQDEEVGPAALLEIEMNERESF